jgi:hypothetical protein
MQSGASRHRAVLWSSGERTTTAGQHGNVRAHCRRQLRLVSRADTAYYRSERSGDRRELEARIRSGIRDLGLTYPYSLNGYLFESPIAYYSASRVWT